MKYLGVAIALWFFTFLLFGCASQPEVREVIKTVEVEVPVQVRREPPPQLVSSPELIPPTFVHPDDEAAVSALTADGEFQLRDFVLELIAREKAWRAWAQD